MIVNDQQMQTTLERIAWFQSQVAHLRRTERNPVNYRASVSGFLAEIDWMQLDVREYFSFLPTETAGAAGSSFTDAAAVQSSPGVVGG